MNVSVHILQPGINRPMGTYKPDLADLTDAASVLSTSGLVNPADEVLGLSVDLFPTPGILFRIAPLKDRMDSFVSALLKEGYDARLFMSLSKDVEDWPEGLSAPFSKHKQSIHTILWSPWPRAFGVLVSHLGRSLNPNLWDIGLPSSQYIAGMFDVAAMIWVKTKTLCVSSCKLYDAASRLVCLASIGNLECNSF